MNSKPQPADLLVFLNGQLLAEEKAKISIFDRGFLYGDGLFETIRVYRGNPFRWADHLERLQRGAEFLGMKIPFTERELREQAENLIERNGMPECLLRIVLTRGVGGQGYSLARAKHPTLAMSLHTAPREPGGAASRWRVITTSFRLPSGEALSQFKTCNKLPQILARAEAESRGADEALLLNTDGAVVEGTASNLFWVCKGVVCTPPLAGGILAGVTRKVVLEICSGLGVNVLESVVKPKELRKAEGVFLSLTSRGVVEVVELDGCKVRRSGLVRRIRRAYDRMAGIAQ